MSGNFLIICVNARIYSCFVRCASAVEIAQDERVLCGGSYSISSEFISLV